MSTRTDLQKQATASWLAENDAAMLLIAHRHIAFTDTELQVLVDRLRGQTLDWIASQPLFSTTLRLLALAKYNTKLLDGSMMALYAKRLIAIEKSPGGPYAVPPDESEILSNAAIAQLFTALRTPLPKVEEYLQISTKKLPLLTVADPTAWILFWPYNLSIHPLDHSKLTTTISPIARSILSVMTPEQKQTLHKTTPNVTAVKVFSDIQSLDPLLRSTAQKIWQKIVAADKHTEITLLSSHFIDSLSMQLPADHVDPLPLNVANFYSWMAYTQYDDFIDDEGIPLRLPIANIAHRRAYNLYHQTAKRIPHAAKRIDKCFDKMDVANTWELTYCRHAITSRTIVIKLLPSYGNKKILAERAGAHILGPTLILESRGSITAQQRHSMHQYLKHYLIARQLNDDLHDWKEDLLRGHSSFVVTYLLRKNHIKPGTYHLPTICTKIQTYFWKRGLEELYSIISYHVACAQSAAEKSNLLKEHSLFFQMTLQPIIDSMNKSKETVKNNKDFLSTYASEN